MTRPFLHLSPNAIRRRCAIVSTLSHHCLPHRSLVPVVLPVLSLLLGTTILAAQKDDDPRRFETAIVAFENEDRQQETPQGGVLFVGSSSIRLWDTDAAFPEADIINRGFGGSQMADVLYYFDRIVTPYQPRLVVLYEGDNDIAKGKPAEQVAAEFKTFVRRLNKNVPEARLVFLSIKPSRSRWHLFPEMSKANSLIQAVCESTQDCLYVDVGDVLLGADGKPDETLYAKDGLHLNQRGYARWRDLVAPLLDPPRRAQQRGE